MRKILRLSPHAFLIVSAMACFFLSTINIYHYGWIQDRHTDAVGKLLYIGLPLLIGSAFIAALRIRPDHRILVVLVILSAAVPFYLVELVVGDYLTYSEQIATLNLQPRARRAASLGLSFDSRTKLEVLSEMRRWGIDAVPSVGNVDIGQSRFFSGISNKTTVYCNEGGHYTVYGSDEHGFHNPKGMWNEGVDIAFLGDSFVHGACVPSEKNFVSQVRSHYPRTMNLGIWSLGPLAELGVLKEYLPALKPKLTLWTYYEGNDVITDLAGERTNPLLMRYLGDFTQRLIHRREEIDATLAKHIEEQETQARMTSPSSPERPRHLGGEMLRFAKLPTIRQKLGLVRGRGLQGQVDPTLLPLFREIIQEAQETVRSWGGEFQVIYLPQWERYSAPHTAAPNRDEVLMLFQELGIPVIDMVPVFEAHGDPLSLFPFRAFGHYNESGHQLVSSVLVNRLKSNR